MATPVTYVFTLPVNDVVQLNTFLRTHVGDPVSRCTHDPGSNTLTVFTNETEARGTTESTLRATLGKYPNPPKAARGPQATTVIDVAHGGTGLAAIPTGRILFGNNDTALSLDDVFAYNAASKDLSVFSISAAPNQPTSPVNKQYVDSLSYLTVGKGLSLTNGALAALDIQSFATLDLSDRATIGGNVRLESATPAVSTLSGALTLPNGGGISTTGAIYGGSIFLGTLPVASEQYVLNRGYITASAAAATFEPVLNLGAGLVRNGGVLSVSAAQPGITSVGNLQNLTVSGAASLLSTLTMTAGTASTSTSTGAIVLQNGAGIGITGSLYANAMYLGTNPVASEAFVQGLGYMTTFNATQTFEPRLTVGAGLTRSGGVLSVNAAQPQITSVGTLAGLTLSGVLTSTSTVSLTNSTAATSTTTGALVLANGGGIGTTGAIHSGAMFINSNAVATENWVINKNYLTVTAAASTYEPAIAVSAGLNRTGNVLSVNAAQPGVTSLGTLTGLTLSGPLTTSSTLTVTSGVASTSTSTGALVLGNGSGLGVTGSLYAASMFLNGDPVASQAYVIGLGYLTTAAAASTYEKILSIGAGLTRTGNLLSVNAAQPGISSLGTLTGLNLSGAMTTSGTISVTNSTPSTSTSTGAVVLSNGAGLGVSGSVYASNMFIGANPVATQAYVTGQGYITTAAATAAFDPLTTVGAGLTRTAGMVLSVNAAQPGVTSLGTLTGLSLSGALTTSSTIAVNNATVSTSTSTGAIVISNGGGLGVSGSVYASNIFVGGAAVASQAFVNSQGFITAATAAATFEPALSINNGLSRVGNVLSVNAAQPGITSVGTLTGLSLSGPLSSSSTVAINNTTASTSTTTGAVVIANGGGLGVSGNVYAANMFIGGAAVASQNYVNSLGFITTAAATAAFDPLTTISTGLTRTAANVLSVNAAQPGITSVGTLTGLALSGALTTSSTITVSSTTASTSTTTGAIVLPNGGGIGTTGNVYAANLFVGTNPVITAVTAAATFEPKITVGQGLSRTGATLSVNAAQPGITSLGTLTGISLAGPLTNSNTTDSTAIGVGSVILAGGLSVARNITTNSMTLASGLLLTEFTGGSWIDLPLTGPSGIGTGGAGANCFIGYCQSAGHWFTTAAAGDVAYRNASGRILWGNSSGQPGMVLQADNLGLGTITPSAKLDVVGNAAVSGNLNVGTAGTGTVAGGPNIIMSDGYDAPSNRHVISFLAASQAAAGYIFVYSRNTGTTSRIGSLMLSFYKQSTVTTVTIAQIGTASKPSTTILSAAASGSTVVITTDTDACVAYTIHFGS